jgi:hypothetical protein
MLHLAVPDLGLSVWFEAGLGRRHEAGADVEGTRWNVRKRAGVATQQLPATGRSLVKGAGCGPVAAVRFPPLRQDLTRRSMTYE